MLRHLICIFFVVQLGFSQTQEIDSLTQLLHSAEIPERYEIINVLATAYLNHNPTKSKQLLDNLLSNSLQAYPAQEGMAHYLKGKAISAQGNYQESLSHFNRAITLFKVAHLKKELGNTYLSIGIAQSYIGKEVDAKKAFQESQRIFEELNDEQGLAATYHQKGHLHYLEGDSAMALEFYKKSLRIHVNVGDTLGISDNYFRMALAYLGQGNREKELDLLVKAKELKEVIGDFRGLAKVKISLGVMHEEAGNVKTAIGYYLQSLEANRKVGDERVNSVIYNNLGVTYMDIKMYDSSLIYYNKALDIRKQLGRKRDIIQSHMNIGEIYEFQEDFERALDQYRAGLTLSETTEGSPMSEIMNDRLGKTFLSQDKLDSAAYYLNEALRLRKIRNDYFNLRGTYKNLSLLNEKQGNFREALAYHQLYKAISDSAQKVNAHTELAEVQAKYDTERQAREIATLQQENEKRTLWRNIFAVGTIVLLAFALMIFQFFIYRSKKNKELLVAKEEQHAQLKEVDAMKSRFFSNISHEFRTPLTLILGPISQLRKNIDDTLHPTLNTMERNGKRLLKLINQLLDLSKIESGNMGLKTTFLDVVPLVKGWVMSFNSMAEAKEVKLQLNIAQDSYFLYVDRGKLEEAIINLMSNALKYTPKGGQITVSANTESNDGFLSITVTDSGSGIPQQELQHIFNRFYQASNSKNEDVTGTGIGLALVKELVELHKGSVHVSSELGKGTTFEILLPLGKTHLSESEIVGIKIADASSTLEEQIPVEQNLGLGVAESANDELPLVLLIEDNAELRNYIKEILHLRFHTIDAVNGEEGVGMAKKHVPDLIISDLMMPKMDGLQVCRLLKEEMLTCHIPIILLTAKSSKEDKIEGLKSLADDYLTKPFDTDELLIRLENLIGLRKKMQAKFASVHMLTPKKIKMSSLDTLFMEKVIEHLEGEISNSLFGVVELAYAVNLSRSQLFRKIKAITNLTPNEYIRSFRLYRAMDLLKQKSGSVAEIAYETGFQNPSYFSKCFQDEFGMPPSSVVKQDTP